MKISKDRIRATVWLIDEIVNTADIDIDIIMYDVGQIKSYSEATGQLGRTQYAKTLESHLENCFIKHNRGKLRQTTLKEFLKTQANKLIGLKVVKVSRIYKKIK